jgi:hypothetical protein
VFGALEQGLCRSVVPTSSVDSQALRKFFQGKAVSRNFDSELSHHVADRLLAVWNACSHKCLVQLLGSHNALQPPSQRHLCAYSCKQILQVFLGLVHVAA